MARTTSNIVCALLLASCLGVLPLVGSAHGGVQQQVGDVTVYLKQQPLSPLVGEAVKLTFVLSKGLNDPLRDVTVTLTVIDTYYGDPLQDKVELTEQKRTDANGAFDFFYTFNKENYFDIDLKFKHPTTGEEMETGFLVQPRIPTLVYGSAESARPTTFTAAPMSFGYSKVLLVAAIALGAGLLLGSYGFTSPRKSP